VETIVAPNTNFVKGGVSIRFTTNLGHGSSKALVRRNMNRSLGLLATTIGVVRTPQMVFTNLIMTTNANMTVDQPLMNLIYVKGYKNIDVGNPG
jgi:hypothetical protein